MLKAKLMVLSVLTLVYILNKEGFAAVADGWMVKQISNSGYISTSNDPTLHISESNIIWGEKSQVMFYDGNTIKQISDGNNSCSNSQISGKNVVWVENNRIMFSDGNTVKVISDSGIYKDYATPQISGGNIVWVRYESGIPQIMFWDGNDITQISRNISINCGQPQISGTNVVWREDVTNNNYVMKIMSWDGNTRMQIPSSSNSCSYPQISGTNVVWVEGNGSGAQIMFWDGTTTSQIGNGSGPKISGTNVVWLDNNQIMFWDGNIVKQLTANMKGKNFPSISGENVVWAETPTVPVTFIYFWDGNTATKLAELPGYNHPTSISGTNIALTGLDENYDEQIFLMQPGNTPPPQPLQGDINKDNIVDFKDLAILCNDWLKRNQ